MSNIINVRKDNEELKEKYLENKILVIENFLVPDFAIKLYKYISKIPDFKWFYSCGIRNTKYEGRIIHKNKKRNADNIREANRSFSKNEFSFNLKRSMDNKRGEICKYEYILRKSLSSRFFLSMISYFTDLKLTNLNQMFLSKYTSGSFLAPHSDIGNGRIAFVLNLTTNWKPQYGGILHFLNDKRNKITNSFVPSFNNLLIFYIPNEGIPHYVSHVVPGIKNNRYAITGWLS